jgi:chromosome segregation ATPase
MGQEKFGGIEENNVGDTALLDEIVSEKIPGSDGSIEQIIEIKKLEEIRDRLRHLSGIITIALINRNNETLLKHADKNEIQKQIEELQAELTALNDEAEMLSRKIAELEAAVASLEADWSQPSEKN